MHAYLNSWSRSYSCFESAPCALDCVHRFLFELMNRPKTAAHRLNELHTPPRMENNASIQPPRRSRAHDRARTLKIHTAIKASSRCDSSGKVDAGLPSLQCFDTPSILPPENFIVPHSTAQVESTGTPGGAWGCSLYPGAIASTRPHREQHTQACH